MKFECVLLILLLLLTQLLFALPSLMNVDKPSALASLSVTSSYSPASTTLLSPVSDIRLFAFPLSKG